MDAIIAALQDALLTIVLALISLGVAYAVSYIQKLKIKAKKQIDAIDDETTRKYATEALNRISELTENAVMSVEQEFGSEIRKQLADGTPGVTRDDLLALKDVVVNKVLKQLTDNTKDAALAQVTDIQNYISDLVEKKLLELKSEGVAVTPAIAPNLATETTN